ncbi:MAG: anti-sigma-D factor RsdA [Labedaea sp.]
MADVPERELGGDESRLRTARFVPAEPEPDDAIDFSLVHADDEFLDALGATDPDPDGSFADDRLAALLLSWRHDVDAEPIGNLVEPKLAMATVQAARAHQRRGPRLLAPLAAAAAVLAIAFAGIGLAAQGAEPGDTLWGLAKVLYADHARSVEAAQAVRTDLSRAQEALASGKVAEAKSMLDQARQALPTVANEDGKDDLQAKHAALEAKLTDNPAVGAAPPPAASPTTAPASGTTTAETSTPSGSTSDNPSPTSEPTGTTEPSGTTTEPEGETPRGGPQTEPTTTNPPNVPNGVPDKVPNNEPKSTSQGDDPGTAPAVTAP